MLLVYSPEVKHSPWKNDGPKVRTWNSFWGPAYCQGLCQTSGVYHIYLEPVCDPLFWGFNSTLHKEGKPFAMKKPSEPKLFGKPTPIFEILPHSNLRWCDSWSSRSGAKSCWSGRPMLRWPWKRLAKHPSSLHNEGADWVVGDGWGARWTEKTTKNTYK